MEEEGGGVRCSAPELTRCCTPVGGKTGHETSAKLFRCFASFFLSFFLFFFFFFLSFFFFSASPSRVVPSCVVS